MQSWLSRTDRQQSCHSRHRRHHAPGQHIQQEDARYRHKKKLGHGGEAEKPLYTLDDVRRMSKQFEPIAVHEWKQVHEGVRVRLHHAGHILGASVVELELLDEGDIKRVVFTGDLGRRNQPILHDPETVGRCDVLISESTYANKLHPDSGDVKAELHRVICEASAPRKGHRARLQPRSDSNAGLSAQ